MAKANKETTFLVSSEGTGYFYCNRKNKKKNKGEKKLSLKKYDPVARKHVLFADKKLSKLKKKYVPGQAASPASTEAA
jgi:large subunit ribosomal protein L33